MRGVRHDISDKVFIYLYKKYGVKGTAEKLGLAMTTVTSRLQTLGVYKVRKGIDYTEENVKYINEHTINQSCIYFKVSISCMKNFIRKYNLSYIPVRVRPPVNKKSIEEKYKIRDTVLKMHETMTYKEIGAILNISPARVCQIVRNNYY